MKFAIAVRNGTEITGFMGRPKQNHPGYLLKIPMSCPMNPSFFDQLIVVNDPETGEVACFSKKQSQRALDYYSKDKSVIYDVVEISSDTPTFDGDVLVR